MEVSMKIIIFIEYKILKLLYALSVTHFSRCCCYFEMHAVKPENIQAQ